MKKITYLIILFLFNFTTVPSFAQWVQGDKIISTTTDNVGIGTANPAGKLQVLGSVYVGNENGWAPHRVSVGGSGGDYGSVGYGYRYTTTSSGHTYAVNDFASQLSFDAGGFTFKTAPIGTNGAAVTFANVMKILQNGNVGIGTSAPTHKLSINGNVRWGGDIDYSYSGQDGSGLYIEQVGKTTSKARIRLQSSRQGDISNYSQFFIDPQNGFSFMNLGNANGNVGIGKTSPAYKLDVAGTVNAGAYLLNGVPLSNGADNLGNHTAAKALNLNYFPIDYVGSLSFSNFATFRTFGSSLYVDQYFGCGGVPAYALDVYGTIRYSNQLLGPSDKRFKKEISSLDSPLKKILSLNGVSYLYDNRRFPDKKFGEGTHFGFIAQDLKEILPNLVETDNEGYLSVNYIELIPVLTEAIKEQQKQIDELKKMVERLASGSSADADGENNTSEAMTSEDVKVYPNPSTGIFTVSVGKIGRGTLEVYDSSGNKIKTIALMNSVSNHTLDLSGQRKGIYTVHINAENKKFVKRIVIE